jgi:hypothetical protein
VRLAGPYGADVSVIAMLTFKRTLDNELWIKHLFYPDEDPFVGKIFEMIAGAAIKAKIKQLKEAEQLPVLDKRFRQHDGAKSPLTLARLFGWAAQVLALPCPELYVRRDVPGALAAVLATPPASVAGNTLLTGFSADELAFIVGKHLSCYRGEHYIKSLFPSQMELNMLFWGAIRIVQPTIALSREIADQVRATGAELAKFMQPVYIEGLRLIVIKLAENQHAIDIAGWSRSVELTACRCGLLMCGDLEVAKKMIAAEAPGDVPREQKVEELRRFSFSPDYAALRAALGVSLA